MTRPIIIVGQPKFVKNFAMITRADLDHRHIEREKLFEIKKAAAVQAMFKAIDDAGFVLFEELESSEGVTIIAYLSVNKLEFEENA